MTLSEQIRNYQTDERRMNEKVTEGRREEQVVREALKEKEREELEKLASIASETLVPFLEIVNKEWLQEEGTINVSEYSPGTRAENAEKFILASLEKTKLNGVGNGSHHDSYRHFALTFKLEKNKNITIIGGRLKNENEGIAINLNEEDFDRRVEGAIFLTLTEKGCVYHSGGSIIDKDL